MVQFYLKMIFSKLVAEFEIKNIDNLRCFLEIEVTKSKCGILSLNESML